MIDSYVCVDLAGRRMERPGAGRLARGRCVSHHPLLLLLSGVCFVTGVKISNKKKGQTRVSSAGRSSRVLGTAFRLSVPLRVHSVSQMLLDLTNPLLGLVAVAWAGCWAWLAAATAAYERAAGSIAGAIVGVLEGAVGALLTSNGEAPPPPPPPAAAERAFTSATSRSAAPGSLVSAFAFLQMVSSDSLHGACACWAAATQCCAAHHAAPPALPRPPTLQPAVAPLTPPRVPRAVAAPLAAPATAPQRAASLGRVHSTPSSRAGSVASAASFSAASLPSSHPVPLASWASQDGPTSHPLLEEEAAPSPIAAAAPTAASTFAAAAGPAAAGVAPQAHTPAALTAEAVRVVSVTPLVEPRTPTKVSVIQLPGVGPPVWQLVLE